MTTNRAKLRELPDYYTVAQLYRTLAEHRNCETEIRYYSEPDFPDQCCLECLDCEAVLIDTEHRRGKA